MAAVRWVRMLYVRHGESHAGRARTLSARSGDDGLTDLGREQVDQLATAIAELGWTYYDPIVTSPLPRAAETAELLATRLGLSTKADERLREIDVGQLDGRSDEKAWAAYAEIHRRWAAGEPSRRFPDGESFRQLCQRLRTGLLTAAGAVTGPAGVRYDSEPPTVLVVGHGAGLRCVLSQLIANVAEAYPSDDMPDASVCCLTASPASRPSVLRLTHWGVRANELHQLRPDDPYGG